MYFHVSCVFIAYRGRRQGVRSLGLKLEIVVSCHVGAGIEPECSGRAASALYHVATSPVPIAAFLLKKFLYSKSQVLGLIKYQNQMLGIKSKAFSDIGISKSIVTF